MNVLKGDYIGFKYNNVHSSDLGIIRISDGSRFNENLLPTMQDKTVQIPGRDGTYYFGSYYTQRQLEILFAFEGVTEKQLNFMKQLFGDKKIHPLVFDEAPYKIYYAKVTGTSTIKYIPFSEGKTNRVYKGEGTIQFTCYQPFAVCINKNLNNYNLDKALEWNEAAQLINTEEENIDILNYNENENSYFYNLYNPGIIESDWELIISFGEDGIIPGLNLYLNNNIFLQIDELESKDNILLRDKYILISSKNNLIEGLISCQDETGEFNPIKSGNIYNEKILCGDFSKIPITIKRTLEDIEKKAATFKIKPNTSKKIDEQIEEFKYNYYYY